MNHNADCQECHTEIPNGMAVIRSIDFVKVAWHRECWALRSCRPLALAS